MKDLFNAPDQASGTLKAMQTTLDKLKQAAPVKKAQDAICLLYTSPSPRDKRQSRMPSSA